MIGVGTMTAGFEADRINRSIDFRHAQDLLDLILRLSLGDVDGLAAEAPRLREPLRDQVPTITTAPSNCAEYAASTPTGPAPAM